MKASATARVPALFLFCIVLCLSCSSSEETSATEMAIQGFYDRLAAEDYGAALAHYTAEVRGMLELPGGGVDDGYMQWAKEETKQGSVDRVAIVEESVEAENADVTYEIFYGDGSSAKRTVSLTLEDGEWKLGFIDAI